VENDGQHQQQEGISDQHGPQEDGGSKQVNGSEGGHPHHHHHQGNGEHQQMSSNSPSSVSPASAMMAQHQQMAAAGVMQQMLATNGMPVVYDGGAAAGWGNEEANYLMNGGAAAYSVSPTAYMGMGYANGGQQQQQRRPPSQTSGQQQQQQISIQPGSPSPASGLLSPSKAAAAAVVGAYNPWSGLQTAPPSTWSPPGAGGPHLGLPINAWNMQQQQRAGAGGGRVVPSMSPSSPMGAPGPSSYAAALSAAAARGKYTNPPGIPTSNAMSPYGAQSNKWGGYQVSSAQHLQLQITSFVLVVIVIVR
jgi:hypothetical protein